MGGPDKPGHDKRGNASALCMPKNTPLSHELSRNHFWRIITDMSLEWIAAGVLVCLFGMIALMPSFDGEWE
jgi:hypothetical protein